VDVTIVMSISDSKKILVITGPTASGKSDLAVEIALLFNGEIVSADSRQVYKGLDIGSGKITKKEMRGIPHHLLDVYSPKKVFTVADFKKKAEKTIDDILSRNKLPILAGGTGFYIQSVVDGVTIPEVKADPKLRKSLEKLSTKDLANKLRKLDLERFNSIDTNNRVRLIRSIEIAKSLGKVPKQKNNPKYSVLQVGITIPDEILRKRIHDRLIKRIKRGMIAEAKKLHSKGLSYKRMEELGLEYRYLAKYLKGELTKQEMIDELETKIWQYAKRQKTWFRRDNRIHWFKPNQKKEVFRLIKSFK